MLFVCEVSAESSKCLASAIQSRTITRTKHSEAPQHQAFQPLDGPLIEGGSGFRLWDTYSACHIRPLTTTLRTFVEMCLEAVDSWQHWQGRSGGFLSKLLNVRPPFVTSRSKTIAHLACKDELSHLVAAEVLQAPEHIIVEQRTHKANKFCRASFHACLLNLVCQDREN